MLSKEIQNSVFKVSGTAAFLAVAALVVTFTAFGMARVTGSETVAELFALIQANRPVFTTAYAAVGIISLFDIFTVPGLYLVSQEGSRVLALWAAILAVIADLFGLIGSILQTSMIQLSAEFAGTAVATQPAILANAKLVSTLDAAFTSAGFLLVGVSFIFFGLALLKGSFGKWLGWVGIAAGVLAIGGLAPSLALLSLGANLLYLVWYVTIGVKFFKLQSK